MENKNFASEEVVNKWDSQGLVSGILPEKLNKMCLIYEIGYDLLKYKYQNHENDLYSLEVVVLPILRRIFNEMDINIESNESIDFIISDIIDFAKVMEEKHLIPSKSWSSDGKRLMDGDFEAELCGRYTIDYIERNQQILD